MEGYFQYGVELPWDGKNALPAMMGPDCMVEVQFKSGHHKETGNAGRFNWMMVKSYKVVDERYKPADPLNGFEWGVEYPTNGERPDLPDDLEIETLSNCGGNWHKSNAGRPGWRFDGGMGDIVKFKITDQRFKPAPAKSWFEAGQLPPVGTVCEYAIDGGHWWPCEIRYVVGDDGVVMWVPHLEKEQYCSAAKTGFRPIRTEREKFIEAAMSVGELRGSDGAKEVYGRLFNAGFKAPE